MRADREIEHKPGAGARRRHELRRFGLVMTAALAVVAALLLWRDRPAWPFFAGAAGLFVVLGLVAPVALGPIERAWMTLARWLSVIMTYALLTLAYFLVVTPMGLIRRLGGRDPLHLKLDRHAKSYWVPVEPDGPGSRSDRPY
jgi:hypothetical protein